MEPEEDKKRKAGAAAVLQKLDDRERLKRLANGEVEPARRSRKEDLVLNQYEQVIASEVIAPEDIALSFDGLQTPAIPPKVDSANWSEQTSEA